MAEPTEGSTWRTLFLVVIIVTIPMTSVNCMLVSGNPGALSIRLRVFHVTNGTVFSGSKFGAKTEDSFTFVYLLSGCSIDDAEVKINDVLGERDNTTYNLS